MEEASGSSSSAQKPLLTDKSNTDASLVNNSPSTSFASKPPSPTLTCNLSFKNVRLNSKENRSTPAPPSPEKNIALPPASATKTKDKYNLSGKKHLFKATPPPKVPDAESCLKSFSDICENRLDTEIRPSMVKRLGVKKPPSKKTGVSPNPPLTSEVSPPVPAPQVDVSKYSSVPAVAEVLEKISEESRSIVLETLDILEEDDAAKGTTDGFSSVQALNKILKDADLFSFESSNEMETQQSINNNSELHAGDTDSSDDEDNKYFEENKYNECGRSIKSAIKNSALPSGASGGYKTTSSWKKSTSSVNPTQFVSSQPSKGNPDFHADPIFKIRLVNPLVSSATLVQKMSGKTPVPILRLKHHLTKGDKEKDWVIAGVIVAKSMTKTSQKGSQYIIWTLSDLKDNLLTVSLFLFGKSYKDLWKTQTGTVVGVLNPKPMKDGEKSKSEATLSVFSPDQVMILGQSKDLGTCKARTKSGDPCSSFVNISQCEYCVYHVQKEYKQFSGRSELQSPYGGGLKDLRNKVLGKNEVFYGGRSFSAVPVKSKKLTAKDKNRLSGLGLPSSAVATPPPPPSISTAFISPRGNAVMNKLIEDKKEKKEEEDTSRLRSLAVVSKPKDILKITPKLKQAETDFVFEISPPSAKVRKSHTKSTNPLQKRFSNLLNITSEPAPVMSLMKLACEKREKEKKDKEEKERKEKEMKEKGVKEEKNDNGGLAKIPVQSQGERKIPPPSAVSSPAFPPPKYPNSNPGLIARQKALEYVRKNGPIKKPDGSPGNKKRGVKRPLSHEEEENETSGNEKSVLSQRFLELMKMKSKNEDLVDLFENQQKDEYFKKMEKKEQLEDKMLTTFKVPCKAVRCIKCKYTWFSASDACKAEGHPLKVVDGLKRFFKCDNCTNRTVCLSVFPLISCRNCGESKWSRAPMMREKVVKPENELSIRGGEQKFVNGTITNHNLNLLVPD